MLNGKLNMKLNKKLSERLKERAKGAVIGIVSMLLLMITVPAFGSAVTSAIQVTYRNIAVSVNGNSIVTEQEPFIFEGRTYLAVRDIAEAFNVEVKMNESTNTLEITSPEAVQQEAAQPEAAQTVNASAQSQSQTQPQSQTQSQTQPQSQTQSQSQTQPQSQTQSQVTSTADKNQRPTNPSITRERAEQIALDWFKQNEAKQYEASEIRRDGGISMDYERGRWVWEVDFESRTHEWEFYIDVDTGEIVHVEVDRD